MQTRKRKAELNDSMKNSLKEIKGVDYIISTPIEFFESLDQLDEFVKQANEQNCGVHLHHEHSNLSQSVLVELYDKETCDVKDFIL